MRPTDGNTYDWTQEKVGGLTCLFSKAMLERIDSRGTCAENATCCPKTGVYCAYCGSTFDCKAFTYIVTMQPGFKLGTRKVFLVQQPHNDLAHTLRRRLLRLIMRMRQMVSRRRFRVSVARLVETCRIYAITGFMRKVMKRR